MIQRNLAATREAILDAAEAAFAERGFDRVSLQEIALAAGVSRGMPNYAFGSKEDLYQAVLARAFEAPRALTAKLTSPQPGIDAGAALAAAVGGYLDFLADRPSYVRLLQHESLRGPDRFIPVTAHLDALADALAATTQLLVDAEFRPVDPRQVVIDILALCFFPLAHQNTVLGPLGFEGFDPRFVALRRAHVVDLVLHGLTTTSAL